MGMIISLQALLTLIWNNATFYTLASYLVCGAFAVLWAVKTLRSGFSPRMAWLALASISALTMLPVYHRTIRCTPSRDFHTRLRSALV